MKTKDKIQEIIDEYEKRSQLGGDEIMVLKLCHLIQDLFVREEEMQRLLLRNQEESL